MLICLPFITPKCQTPTPFSNPTPDPPTAHAPRILHHHEGGRRHQPPRQHLVQRHLAQEDRAPQLPAPVVEVLEGEADLCVAVWSRVGCWLWMSEVGLWLGGVGGERGLGLERGTLGCCKLQNQPTSTKTRSGAKPKRTGSRLQSATACGSCRRWYSAAAAARSIVAGPSSAAASLLLASAAASGCRLAASSTWSSASTSSSAELTPCAIVSGAWWRLLVAV